MSFYTNNMNMSEQYRFQRIFFDEYFYFMITDMNTNIEPWLYVVIVDDKQYFINDSNIPSNVTHWVTWMEKSQLLTKTFENVSLTLENWYLLEQQRDTFEQLHALTHCSIEDFLNGNVYEEVPLIC